MIQVKKSNKEGVRVVAAVGLEIEMVVVMVEVVLWWWTGSGCEGWRRAHSMARRPDQSEL